MSQNYEKPCKHSFFLIFISLGGIFSCAPSEMQKITLAKIKPVEIIFLEKSRIAYRATRESLGIKEDPEVLSTKPMTVSKKVFGTLANGSKDK